MKFFKNFFGINKKMNYFLFESFFAFCLADFADLKLSWKRDIFKGYWEVIISSTWTYDLNCKKVALSQLLFLFKVLRKGSAKFRTLIGKLALNIENWLSLYCIHRSELLLKWDWSNYKLRVAELKPMWSKALLYNSGYQGVHNLA